MLEYNEVKPGVHILLDGEPFECLTAHVFRKQQRKPVNATKLRSLKTGRIVEYSFGASEKAAEAELTKRSVMYLYHNKGEYWFHELTDKSKRFQISAELLGDKSKFLKPNSQVEVVMFNEDMIGVNLPIKVELKVTEAPPNMRGNTAQGGNKQVTLETGANINVPLFIEEGDVLRINTQTGEYVERV